MKKISVLLILFIYVVSVSGCSVNMAASGKVKPHIEAVVAGEDRTEVLKNLGKPAIVEQTSYGLRETFYVKRGNPVLRYGRAFVYIILDLGTLGLWELLGTPLEEFIQNKNSITVTYDENNKVIDIMRLSVP